MDKLEFINDQMTALGVPYQYGEWVQEADDARTPSVVKYPYTVGEISEDPVITEDGAEESTLILTCWNRGALIVLEEIKKKIKKHFHPIHGLRGNTDSGVIAVFYDASFPIPSGQEGLKKMQINLKIKEWKGDL